MGRNGVDLFFVISGFCMYVMYEKKSGRFDWATYGNFLGKRFKRIAPAFYVLIMIETVLILVKTGVFPGRTVLYHLLFINIFLPHNEFSPHYWSLATEWEFYLVLPFLFLRDTGKKYFLIRVWALALGCLVMRLLLFSRHSADIVAGVTVDSDAIWYRFIEFAAGIIAGKFYLENRQLPRWLQGGRGFVLSLMIAYAGRVCMMTEFVVKFKQAAFAVRALGEPIMTAGFGLMLFGLVTSESRVRQWISRRPVLFAGKISYSMYLWHWLVSQYISNMIIARFHENIYSFYFAFLLSFIIAIPVSWLSYRLFEAPYFKKSREVSLRATSDLEIAREVI
jgi:peptidoglycan/LPS O-acetylase OafA/YrhL